MFKKQTSQPTLVVSWCFSIQKMSMTFLSKPTLLIKLVCVGTASTSPYLSKEYNFWSDGDVHHNLFLGISFFVSTKSALLHFWLLYFDHPECKTNFPGNCSWQPSQPYVIGLAVLKKELTIFV